MHQKEMAGRLEKGTFDPWPASAGENGGQCWQMELFNVHNDSLQTASTQ